MTKLNFKLTLCVAFTIFSNATFAFTNIPQNKATIRALNKQTGRTKDIEIPVGEQTIFENILIDMKACFTRPEDETPENSSFVQITEINTDFKEELTSVKKGNVIFSGWMFSSSPSLSAMEHPNYDIWLLECRDDPRYAKITLPQNINQNSNSETNEIN